MEDSLLLGPLFLPMYFLAFFPFFLEPKQFLTMKFGSKSSSTPGAIPEDAKVQKDHDYESASPNVTGNGRTIFREAAAATAVGVHPEKLLKAKLLKTQKVGE